MDEKKGTTIEECAELFMRADTVCYQLEHELRAVSPERQATLNRLGALLHQKAVIEDMAMRKEAHAAYLTGRAEAAEEHIAYMADAKSLSGHRKTTEEQNERWAVGSLRTAAALEGILAILKERPKL